MAKHRLKRKTFGVVQNTLNGVGDTLKTTAGGIMEGVGRAAETNAAGVVGGALTAAKFGGAIGSVLGGGFLGKAIGTGLGYVAGKALTKGIGRGVKNAGQDLQM